eukprot:TRINITY_DN12076_c0_g1_i1.p1 TRINITY_DN12076_c0_g1~~TRINITY_DN12076_c0_g1_i1.p1  ORF type:complete len:512 (+),score=77.75 TRINITY_DN12076_c0_g1_i1:125-1660(+)
MSDRAAYAPQRSDEDEGSTEEDTPALRGFSPSHEAGSRSSRGARGGKVFVARTIAAAAGAVAAYCVARRVLRGSGGDGVREREASFLGGSGAEDFRPAAGGPGEPPEVIEAALQAQRPLKDAHSQGRAWRWVTLQGGHRVPVDEGDELQQEHPVHARDCSSACLKTPGCKYVITCAGDCHMKTKDITPFVETKHNGWCSTHVYTNIPYLPATPALASPSSAPAFTFYMYRTQGPQSPNGDYPLENVNAASAGGVLWYLHHEMIKDCWYGNNAGQRRFGATRIRRFKVTYKAPQPLHDKGMNFGTLCSFDSGECTGPHRHGWAGPGSGYNSKAEWEDFGFYVGCGKLGDYPHQEWQSGKRYPDAVWYSLPGPCPTQNFRQSTDECKNELPGGHCKDVTGQGNCTYSTEPAGEIDIDELVGITPRFRDRAAYCRAGCSEGDPEKPLLFQEGDEYNEMKKKGCTVWWADIWNPIENEVRVQKMLDKFHEKYPNMPRDDQLKPPECDYSRLRYLR